MDLRWYYYLVKSPDATRKGPNLFDSETVDPTNVLVCQEMKYRTYTKFDSIHDLIKFVSKVKFSHNCLYEIIRGKLPHKWYTDIDIALQGYCDDEENNFILPEEETICVVHEVKKALLTLLPMIKESDILVASSNGTKKHSYHIILDNWCLPNKDENKALFIKVLELLPERYKGALDNSMYKSIQQFRMYGSHKWGSDRTKIFREDLSTWKPPIAAVDEKHLELLRFTAFLIGHISQCSYLPSFLPEKEAQPYEGLDNDLNKDDIDRTLKLFRERFPTSCKFKYLSHSKCFITLKRLAPSMCKICKRRHEHENPYLLVVGENRNIYFDCRRAPPDTPKIYLGRLGPMDEEPEPEPEPEPEEEESDIKITKKDILSGLVAEKSKNKITPKQMVGTTILSNTLDPDSSNTLHSDSSNTLHSDSSNTLHPDSSNTLHPDSSNEDNKSPVKKKSKECKPSVGKGIRILLGVGDTLIEDRNKKISPAKSSSYPDMSNISVFASCQNYGRFM